MAGGSVRGLSATHYIHDLVECLSAIVNFIGRCAQSRQDATFRVFSKIPYVDLNERHRVSPAQEQVSVIQLRAEIWSSRVHSRREQASTVGISSRRFQAVPLEFGNPVYLNDQYALSGRSCRRSWNDQNVDRRQTRWVDQIYRIGFRIPIYVYAPSKPDRILTEEPSRLRIIVSGTVVVEAGIAVELA